MRIEIRGAEKLSFRERQVVTLKETGHRNNAIAKRLGISAGTVATLFNRARSKGYEVVIVLPGDALGIFDPGADDDEDGPDEDSGGDDD